MNEHETDRAEGMGPIGPGECAPHLFDAIDRRETNLPDWYMPLANVILVASKEVVRRATDDRPEVYRRRALDFIQSERK
jgi:hypothetical protein